MFRTPVCCTVYASPTDLWLQTRWDGARQLKDLTRQITAWASTSDAAKAIRQQGGQQLAQLRTQDWVLARPSGQSLWFRGKILAASGDQERLVRLVDFGDRVSVTTSDAAASLLPMPAEFREPAVGQAVLCKLARIGVPARGRWLEGEVKLLERLITMATEDLILEAEFDWQSYTSEEEPVAIELFQRSGQSINDTFGQKTRTLVKERRTAASFINSWPAAPHLAAAPSSRAAAASVEAPPSRSWEPFEGRISHVTDQGTVFMQKNEKRLSDLQSQLQLFHGSDDLHRFSYKSPPLKDEIFAVFQPDGSYHYRGRVLECMGDQRVRLLIIDFGFEQVASWEQCARLPSIIRYEPQCQAFVPTDIDGVPTGVSLKSQWKSADPKARSAKVLVTPNAQASGPEIQAAKIVVIRASGEHQSILDFLLHDSTSGKAVNDVATGAESTTHKQQQPTSYRPCQSDLNWDVDNIVCAGCTHVDAANSVAYFQPTVMQLDAVQVNSLLRELLASRGLSTLDRPSTDQLLRVRQSGDSLAVLVKDDDAQDSDDQQQLRRGSITEFDASTQTCRLTFVDSGAQASSVSLVRVYSPPPDILSIPSICVKCLLQATSGDDTNQQQQLKPGDTRIFSILGVADGAYQISILRSG